MGTPSPASIKRSVVCPETNGTVWVAMYMAGTLNVSNQVCVMQAKSGDGSFVKEDTKQHKLTLDDPHNMRAAESPSQQQTDRWPATQFHKPNRTQKIRNAVALNQNGNSRTINMS